MGGKNSTTQTTSAEPYAAAKPLLNQGMNDALGLYKSGGLVRPNTMSTVVPYAKQTMQGMQGLSALGTANTGGRGISGQYQGMIDSGGFNAPQLAALGGIQKTATGGFDLASDPGFQQVLDKTRDTVNAGAASMGRYGGGAHQGVMAKEIGDLTARQYTNWQQRQDSAQRDLFNMGQVGAGQLGQAYQGAQDAYSPLMQVGSMNEDLMGRQMNDQLRIAQERQNAPLANIQALLGIAGQGSPYATQTARAQGPSNTFSNVLGAGLGGASLIGGGKL